MDGSYKTLDEDNSSNNNSEDGSNQSNGDIPMDTVPRDFSTKKSSSNSNNNNNNSNNNDEEEEEETTDSWDEEDETTESGSNSGNTSSDSSTTGLTSVNIAEGEGGISGYLHKKSKWHSKAKVHRLKWRRKWYTLSGEAFYSCKDPLFPDVGHHDIPLADVRTVEVGCDDASPRVFVVKMAGSKKYTFRAQSKEAAAEWAARIREAAAAVAARRANEIPSLSESSGVTPALTPVETEDEGHSMWEMPSDKLWRKVMWALALPFYALFTITIPNVKKKRFENWFVVSFIVCLAWIAGLSYGMVWCGERFAHVLGIPEDIMGLTITAIGASLPSFFGSVIAAREGSFHMAVSNTFGANLSSILVALGLPCFIQTVFVNSGEPFAMESDSIVITVIVLVVGLLVFLASIFITRLWLNKPLGILYFALYFILLGTVVVFQMLGIYF